MWEELVKKLSGVNFGGSRQEILDELANNTTEFCPDLKAPIKTLLDAANAKNTPITVFIERLRILVLFGE